MSKPLKILKTCGSVSFVNRVLVTGGSGLIGSRVVALLEARNIEVVAPLSSKYDLRKIANWKDLPKCDSVIHAAVSLGDRATDKPHSPGGDNDQMLKHALQFAKRNDAGFVFLSTYLYGETPVTPTVENSPLIPLTAYADMKLRGEIAVKNYSRESTIPSTILRLFNVYGPGQSERFVLGKIIEGFKSGKKIDIEHLNTSRDFVFVDDVAAAILLVAEMQTTLDVFNIGSGYSTPLTSIIKTIEEITQSKLDLNILHTDSIDRIPKTCASIRKILNAFGWEPSTSVQQGLYQCLYSDR